MGLSEREREREIEIETERERKREKWGGRERGTECVCGVSE